MEKSGRQKVVRKIFASYSETRLSFKNIPVRLACIKALNYLAAYIQWSSLSLKTEHNATSYSHARLLEGFAMV